MARSKADTVIDVISLSSSFLDRFDFISLAQLGNQFRKKFGKPEFILPVLKRACKPEQYIPHFWELVLKLYCNENIYNIDKDNYCFEFHDDNLSDVVPHYHGNRLMKDEYIDGEIARDVCRTFPHHLLFRHSEYGGQVLLENVLRKVSDNYFGLGYCQGMNYVVGAIMIALIDPELNGYYSDNDTDELQYRIRNLDIEDIRSQMYEIMGLLIDRLQMIRLWGYGFPDIPMFVYILRNLYSPKLRDHFDSLGFDLSIVVTRWFIPLFSNNMSFSLLFRIWDYLFIVGISGMFRVTMALLLHYSNEILASDLIQLSNFIHDVGVTHLQKEKEVQSFFRTMISLHDINVSTYAAYQSEFNDRCRVTMSEESRKKHEQLTSDISVLLGRIKKIHDEESLLRNDLRNNILDKYRFSNKVETLHTRKGNLERKYTELLETSDEAQLRSVMSDITSLKATIRQSETDLKSLQQRIDEGVQNLEDNNTQRLSLRIQLAQLMKERSLLLCQVVWD